MTTWTCAVCGKTVEIKPGEHPDGWRKEMPAKPGLGLPAQPCICPECGLKNDEPGRVKTII